MNYIGSIAFVAHPNKAAAITTRDNLIALAEARKYECSVLDAFGNDFSSFPFKHHYDLIVAIGGDGTILKASNMGALCNSPILGVNLGRVGFLSEIVPDEFESALTRFEQGNFILENRMMLQCVLNGQIGPVCLNDILLYKQTFSGIAQIDLEINGIDAGTILGDGIVISTPTGATAYSFSAGGPIIAPDLDVMIVTPVCPHTLYARPIVANANSHLRFTMQSEGRISADGYSPQKVVTSDSIEIFKADIAAQFIRFNQHNIYQLIKQKL